MAADASGAWGVRLTDWARDEPKLRAVRHAVFVVEQGIAPALEWDAFDAASVHALAEDPPGRPVGCGRLLPDGHVGRMAVLAAWRRRSIGAALLERLVACAQARGDARAILNAQVRAIPFYARHGFVPTGEEFIEAGIAHRVMERALR